MLQPRKQAKIRENARLRVPNLHYGEMKLISRASIRELAAKYGLTQYTTKQGKRFWYKDNGSKVLFVGHEDTVQSAGTFQPVHFKTETRIYYPTADDRAGLYVGLCYLPKANIKVDILITEDEEEMRSTALWFDPPKQYNWMFMFDRQGTGAVTYQYDSPELRYKLGKHNFVHYQGTYSCIRELEHLGVCGVNFGVGYYNNHSEFAYVVAEELKWQLRKFIDFFHEYQYTRMPHDVGYTRFAQSFNYHYYEQKRIEQSANMVRPRSISKLKTTKIPVEQLFGIGDVIDAEFEEVADKNKFKDDPSIDESTFDDWHYKDYGELRQEELNLEKKMPHKIVSSYVVTEDGRIKYKEERSIFRLYWPISNLNIDAHHANILRNTFKIHKVYDLVQASPYALVNSGMFTAAEVDNFVKEATRIGFGLSYNVQCFMTPAQWEKQHINGWKKREKILRTSPANKKPVKKNQRLETVALQKYEEAKTRPAEQIPRSNKLITFYPLPGTSIKYMLQQMRNLQRAGYVIEARFICKSCNKDSTFDINFTDQLPEYCETCHGKETSKSSSQKDRDIYVPSTSSDTGMEVFTKIQLRKDTLDDTQYGYIGKAGGKGVDKYAWKKPTLGDAYRRSDGADIYVRERLL